MTYRTKSVLVDAVQVSVVLDGPDDYVSGPNGEVLVTGDWIVEYSPGFRKGYKAAEFDELFEDDE